MSPAHDLIQTAERLPGAPVTWTCTRGCGEVTDELIAIRYRCDVHPGHGPHSWRGLLAGLTGIQRRRLWVVAAAAGAALVAPLTAVYLAAHLIRWMVIG